MGLLPQAVCADGNCELADPARAGAVAPKAPVREALARVVLPPVELDASACWDRRTIAAHGAEVDSAEAGREKGMPLLRCLEHAAQGATARLRVRYEATMQENGWSQLSRYDYRIDAGP